MFAFHHLLYSLCRDKMRDSNFNHIEMSSEICSVEYLPEQTHG